MVIVKATKEFEAGQLPSRDLLVKMGKYNDVLTKAGVMLAGDGLRPSSKGTRVRFRAGQASVTDGPFAETKELVGGYWIWQCPTHKDAVEWLKQAPFDDADVEIRQLSELEDFAEAFK
ncbi:MAG: YciI family protein [Verrucomicrobiota bacterium]